MSDQIEKIKKMLSAGKEHKAMKAIVELLKTEKNGNDFLNTAFLLQARLEGVESKFNQGITSYDKWEISRNKILKSILEFVSKIESSVNIDDSQVEVKRKGVQKSIATNSMFIHRLAEPSLFRKMAFYYLVLWIVIGALDSLFFQVQDLKFVKTYQVFGIEFKKYIADDSITTWIQDLIGHLFAFGTAALAIVLQVIKSNISTTSTIVLNEVNDLYKKYFWLYAIVGIGLIALVIFFNASYINEGASMRLWSTEISADFLPPFIAINYFTFVMIPLTLSVFHYCIMLHVTVKKFKNFSSYHPFHGDKNFGLSLIGRSVFWGTLSFMFLMLLALILQLVLKNGELTFGIFIGAFVFVVLAWFGAINPLIKLSTKLKTEKEGLYESIKDQVRSNNRMLSIQSTAEDLNTVKLLLDASRENEKELLELNVFPISRNEILFAAGIFFFLLATIVYKIA